MGAFICAALAPAKPSPAVTNSAIISLDMSFPYGSSTLSQALSKACVPAYFKRMSFLTDLTPSTLRATSTAVFSAACELTKPLS